MPTCPFDGIEMPCGKAEIIDRIGDYGAIQKILVNRYVCNQCGMIVKVEYEVVKLFDDRRMVQT